MRVSALAGEKATSAAKFSMLVNASIPDPNTGERDIEVNADTHNVRYTFKLPHGEHSLSIRLLADRTVVEAFVASGRVAITASVKFDTSTMRAYILTEDNSVTVNKAEAWSMGFGWQPTWVDELVGDTKSLQVFL